MKDQRYFLIFVILLVIQMILDNYVNLSQYLFLTMLPAIIMCIPMRHGLSFSLLVAFIAGVAVDFFGGGVLGMTSAALLPVALLRNPIFRLCFDSETVSRIDEISIKKMGFFRLLICAALELTVFLVLYIWIDGAGTRTLGFNLLRFLLSFAVGILLSAVTIKLFSAQADRR